LRSDWAISGCTHAALILFALVTLAHSKPSDDTSQDIPVTIVTDADMSRAAIGEKNAPKVTMPKRLADKVGQEKSIEQLAPKVSKAPPITTESTVPLPQPTPRVQQKPKPDTKTAQKLEKKSEKKTDQFKPDKIAELLKKTEPPKPRDKPTPNTPKYDANQIAQLLDHRDPQRQIATADAVNSATSLGSNTAAPNAQLSQSEIDALKERIRDCWSPPPGVDSNSNIYVSLRVLFKPDGTLAQMPVVVAGSASPLGPALAESGERALLQCQPFTMLKPEHYAQWKDITVDFDPRDLSN
jgi:outer membrane biosynthesis protein TonB